MPGQQTKKQQQSTQQAVSPDIITKIDVWYRNFSSVFTTPMILDDQRRVVHITLWILFGTLAISFPIAYMFNDIFIAFTCIAVAYILCILMLCPNWLKRKYANPHWVKQNVARDYYERLKNAKNEWHELKKERERIVKRLNKK